MKKNESDRNERAVTRRDFIRGGAAVAAGLAFGLKPTYTIASRNPKGAETSRIVSYNSDMEYRQCGKTGWMVSAVCLGGHWKRIDVVVNNAIKGSNWLAADMENDAFHKNRYDVVTRCIERGINYVDACCHAEIMAYSKALKGRRDKMYLGWSHYEHEARKPEFRTADKLLATFDASLKEAGEDYVDLWRITCNETGTGKGPDGKPLPAHTPAESEQIAKALERAKASGRARCVGISSHDRPWLEYMMKNFPDSIEVVVTPYTAKSKVLEQDSFFQTAQKLNCGFFGIKPFASNSLFKGDSSPGSPTAEEDNRLARLAIRYILCNPAISAPIPGLISVEQVDNVALAVMERRELDAQERADLDAAMDRAWASLPPDYQWLRNWECV